MRVPLSYSHKDAMLARVKQDPTLTKETAIVLPRMSFELLSMNYDGDRKRKTIDRIPREDTTNANKFKYVYSPVPYNLNFALYVYVKNAEDGTKIVEQILPFFTPDFTTKVHIIPDLNITDAIPTEITGVSCEDHYDTNYAQRQSLIWTLNFTMKANFYGPTKKMPIIKFANERFFIGGPDGNNITANASSVVDTLTVQPGLDANGNPTANANLSINALSIFVDQNWDYVIQQSGLVLVQET